MTSKSSAGPLPAMRPGWSKHPKFTNKLVASHVVPGYSSGGPKACGRKNAVSSNTFQLQNIKSTCNAHCKVFLEGWPELLQVGTQQVPSHQQPSQISPLDQAPKTALEKVHMKALLTRGPFLSRPASQTGQEGFIARSKKAFIGPSGLEPLAS